MSYLKFEYLIEKCYITLACPTDISKSLHRVSNSNFEG
jgi:hypothetical protein